MLRASVRSGLPVLAVDDGSRCRGPPPGRSASTAAPSEKSSANSTVPSFAVTFTLS